MKQKFNVYGMSCSACVNHVDKAVRKVNGVIDVNVSLVSNSMIVNYDESVTSDKEIIEAVRNDGYNASVKENKDIKSDNKKENKKILNRIICSSILLVLVMYFSMGPMMGLPSIGYFEDINNTYLYGLVLFVLTLPVLIINRIYFIRGFKNLFTRKSNMDTLIALGSSASFIYATVSFIIASIAIKNGNVEVAKSYRTNLYFDSSAMILTLVTLGKFLESLAKSKTTKSIDKMIKLLPESVTVLVGDKEVSKQIEEIELKDKIIIRTGERVPVDGIVIKGNASLDQSSITGESIPVYVSENDKVTSSSLNVSGYIIIEATSVNSDSTMQKLINLVDEAANSKAPISRIADRVSRIFVPTVLSISLITLIVWLCLNDYESALRYAISVLVISCPCALGLATPVAIMVSVGKSASFGVINKTAESIEIASTVNAVVLDKTGTITKGSPSVTDLISFNNCEKQLLETIYSLEIASTHPLSGAIIKYAKEHNSSYKEVSSYEYVIGKGIKGLISDKKCGCGNIKFIEEENLRLSNNEKEIIEEMASLGKTVLVVYCDESVIGCVGIMDEVKEQSIEAIKAFKKLGIEVIMATGDNPYTANAIAKSVGISEVRAGILPVDKAKIVNELKNQGKVTSMIGDGINDSLALVESDLGIAIGEGSDIAIDYAQTVLMKSSLMDAVDAIRLARKTMNVIKFNLFWAFLYNVIAIPVACGLFSKFGLSINPMISSIAMSSSSLIVVLTALTLNTFKKSDNSKKIEEINNNEKEKEEMKEVVIVVEGMMCMHCEKRVKEAISKVENVTNVTINLETKEVKIEYKNELNMDLVKKAVLDAGYEVK